MKAIIKATLLCIALFATNLAAAQRGGRDMDPEARAERQTERMKEKLSLTEEQLPIIKSINLKYAKKMQEIRQANTEGDWESMRANMKALNSQKKVELQAILTKEQFDALEAWEAERMQQRQGRRGKGNKEKKPNEGQ